RRDLGGAEEQAPVAGDGQHQLLLLVLHLLRRGARQVDLDAALDQRRGHHEDDQEHQHDVDQRRHVDVRHRPPRSRFSGAECHQAAFLKMCRLMMLRKSALKLRISLSSTRMRELKALYATSAGMAAKSPTAVATSASEIGRATVARLAFPAA